MRTAWALSGLILVSIPMVVLAYTEQAVPGRTGGFGGPTCQACHIGSALNAPGAALAFSGVPERYVRGETYRIRVTLTRPGLERGGFSLAARFAAGAASRTQAGAWQSSDPGVVFQEDVQTKVQYAQHSAAGTLAPVAGSLRWELDWKAPDESVPVQLNLAATASNNDRSPHGDVVYTREVTVPAALR